MEHDKIETTTTEARQAVTGHGVRYVLGFSLVGALIAMAVVFFLFFR